MYSSSHFFCVRHIVPCRSFQSGPALLFGVNACGAHRLSKPVCAGICVHSEVTVFPKNMSDDDDGWGLEAPKQRGQEVSPPKASLHAPGPIGPANSTSAHVEEPAFHMDELVNACMQLALAQVCGATAASQLPPAAAPACRDGVQHAHTGASSAATASLTGLLDLNGRGMSQMMGSAAQPYASRLTAARGRTFTAAQAPGQPGQASAPVLAPRPCRRVVPIAEEATAAQRLRQKTAQVLRDGSYRQGLAQAHARPWISAPPAPDSPALARRFNVVQNDDAELFIAVANDLLSRGSLGAVLLLAAAFLPPQAPWVCADPQDLATPYVRLLVEAGCNTAALHAYTDPAGEGQEVAAAAVQVWHMVAQRNRAVEATRHACLPRAWAGSCALGAHGGHRQMCTAVLAEVHQEGERSCTHACTPVRGRCSILPHAAGVQHGRGLSEAELIPIANRLLAVLAATLARQQQPSRLGVNCVSVCPAPVLLFSVQ